MMGLNGNLWEIDIDLKTNKILNWNNEIASIHYKVCDEGTYFLLDDDLNPTKQYKYCYVPDWLSHFDDGSYGDYIIFQ
jgi:hypothetical protein